MRTREGAPTAESSEDSKTKAHENDHLTLYETVIVGAFETYKELNVRLEEAERALDAIWRESSRFRTLGNLSAEQLKSLEKMDAWCKRAERIRADLQTKVESAITQYRHLVALRATQNTH